MVKEVYVVECPHNDIYGCFREEEIANRIRNGCCEKAVVIKYTEVEK